MMLPPGAATPAARRQVAEAVRGRVVHPAVLEAMVATTPAQERSLNALSEGLAVVTGQQAGFLGGPLYTVYKAAAAVVDARALAEETGHPVAPVFWLQDEDHDYAEIRAASLLARDGAWVDAALPEVPTLDGVSVAARPVPEGADVALQAAASALEGRPFAAEVDALHRAAWCPGHTLAQAFRHWLERLFAPHGLLVLDPADEALVDAARPVHLACLERRDALAAAMAQQAEALVAAGRPAPVHVRPGAPLSFFHPDGPTGPRFRVEASADTLTWVGRQGTVTEAELRGLHATTSALQRPLLQDLLLPTVAYVGGPGERAYLAQLPPLWRAFERPPPLVVPRARFRWLDVTARKRIAQLGLDAADLDGDLDAWATERARVPEGWPAPDDLAPTVADPGVEALAAFAERMAAHDPGLARSAARVQRAYRYHAERLATRYRRMLAREDEVLRRRIGELKVRVQPGGAPQERAMSAAPALAAVGIDAFVQAVIDAVVPFDGELRDLEIG